MRYLALAVKLALFLYTGAHSQRLETVVQRGHYEAVKAVAFTLDGKYLLSGSRDKSIKLWELSTGREIRSYLGHKSTINDLVITPDGKHFVSSCADYTAKLWNIATGELVRSFEGHTDYLTSVAVSLDSKYLLTAGFDWEAILWDINTGLEIRRYKVSPDKGIGYGIDAAFGPDNKMVYFGSDNRSVRTYKIEGGDQLMDLKPEKGFCGGCGTFIHPLTDKVISASNKGDLKIWNTKNGSTEKVLYTNPDEFSGLDFDGKDRIVVATLYSIKLFSLSKNTLLWEVKIDAEKDITDVRMSPDGKTIALSNDDNIIRIVDAANGKVTQILDGFLNHVDKGGLNYDANYWDRYIKKYTDLKNDVAISPDGKYLAKGKLGRVVRLWNFKEGKIIKDLIGHDRVVLTMQFSKNGQYLLTGSADNTAKLWDVQTGEALVTYKGHREVIFSVAFSDDGKKIATGSWDGTAKIWDRETGKLITTLVFEQASPYQLKFVNNDIYLLAAQLDKTLKLWEVDSKKEVRNFIGHTDVIHSFDIHPGLPVIASTSWDGKIKIWDMNTGLQSRRFSDHEGPTYVARYSNSGSMLCTTGADRTIKVRNTESDYVVTKELKGHSAPVTNLCFTPDDKHLISASENGEVIIWDLANGKELVNYITLSQREWMAVNADGHFNATEGAFQNIVFVKGMESYSADQFFDEFYKPNLVKDVFTNRSGNRLNMLDKMQQSPPPEIEILTPKNNQAYDQQKADILFKVTDKGGGAKTATLFQNGKAILAKDLQVKPGRSQVVEHKFNLVPGVNVIEVSASSKGNIESHKSRVQVQFGGDLKSSLYLLAIGINEYQNESLNLNYASADAEGFVDLIRTQAKSLFDKVEVISIYDKEATKENILQKLDELKGSIRPQDVLYLYYAGHGSMVDNNFYFIPTNNTKLYSNDKLKKTGIYAGELQEKLKAIAALKQVVIIDACQSGGGAEILAQRGATEEKALAQLSRSTGIHVLAAAGSEQFATEFTELGHGLFTYVLLEALSGKADGAPKDGKITIYELKGYLDDQVPELSKKYKGKMQFPHTFSRGQDFPLVVDQ
ncbi:MAG: caspase family protein [Fulvivirga sp.]